MVNVTENEPLVQIKKISKSFPGVQALDGVDFKVYGGETVALLGENGAGKSTLMKILSGVYHPDSGEVIVGGQTIVHESVQKAQELGISIIYQEFNLTPNQSVSANIFLGREPRQKGLLGKLGFVDRQFALRETQVLLKRVGARFSPEAKIRQLSVAEQQMVEIAKSLATKSKVIIMDEPTSALGKEDVKVLFEIIRNLKSQGLGIIFITHRMEEVFEIADRIVVLRDGKFVKEMKVEETDTNELIMLMVGRKLDRESFQWKTSQPGNLALEVKNLKRGDKLKDISFSVKRGEIFGIAGLVGAGRTETVRAIFGADQIESGEIWIHDQKVKISNPVDAVRAGLALVPESRQAQGLVLKQSIERNILLPNLKILSRARIVNLKAVRTLVSDFIQRLKIRTPSAQQRVMNLSGGNQQKVVIAKWLASNPKVLILDEPTRGIDVGAKAEIYAIMHALAEEGIGIIMISSELPEVLLMSDRIMVMYEGRVTGILSRAEATQENIMAYASGQSSYSQMENN